MKSWGLIRYALDNFKNSKILGDYIKKEMQPQFFI